MITIDKVRRMRMIQYPELKQQHVGITAPSSGVDEPLHPLLHQAIARLETLGFATTLGETAWTQHLSLIHI